MQKLKLLYRETNWWWPLLYGVGGAFLTALVLAIDLYAKELFPNDWKTTLGLAQTIHSAVFTGLLTMMTFTFSTILVVLTTYSSQFSPGRYRISLRTGKSNTSLEFLSGPSPIRSRCCFSCVLR